MDDGAAPQGEPMSVEEVRAEVARISAVRGDDATAHYMQDEMFIKVLTAMRDGAGNPQALAAAALEVLGANFDRWCT